MQGVRQPSGIFLRRPSHIGQEKHQTPALPLHSGIIANVSDQRPGPGLKPVLWCGIDEGIFFNLNLKFAPTGSRTQDLGSATGPEPTNQLS
jgi:hypothetical protein